MLATLALVALPALALASSPHVGASPRQHRSFSTRVLRARGGDPADISKGSLTTAEGCTKFRHVAVGEFCIQVAREEGIQLDDFYAMNPQIDSTCMNLWANSDYCVARTTSSPASSPSSTKAVASTSSFVAAVTTKSLAPVKAIVATSAAPAPTASASASDDEDDEDEECDADDDEEDDSTSSETAPSTSAKAVVAAAPTTTEAAAPTTTTTSSSSAAAAATSTAAASSSLLSSLGITGFLGKNSGIGSWFHADLSSDSTNGHSWCGFPYSDSSPGFAPSVGTMLKNFGGDYEKAATAYCGLEAIVTAPDGTTSTGVILDGFDDAWVLSPGSIDLMYNFFTKMNGGKSTTDKNTVIKGITWELTGTRNEQYKFKGTGN